MVDQKHGLQKILPDSRSHILFVGFSNENSLATKVKNGNKQKTITIDKKSIPNRCGINDLKILFISYAKV